MFSHVPKVPGIIIVTNERGEHGFTMWSETLRHRVEAVEADFRAGPFSRTSHQWGEGREAFADNSEKLVYTCIPMPNTPMAEIKRIAKTLDKESFSKIAKKEQVDNLMI